MHRPGHAAARHIAIERGIPSAQCRLPSSDAVGRPPAQEEATLAIGGDRGQGIVFGATKLTQRLLRAIAAVLDDKRVGGTAKRLAREAATRRAHGISRAPLLSTATATRKSALLVPNCRSQSSEPSGFRRAMTASLSPGARLAGESVVGKSDDVDIAAGIARNPAPLIGAGRAQLLLPADLPA